MFCQCGAQAGYPHRAECPYPEFTDDPESVRRWNTARMINEDPPQDRMFVREPDGYRYDLGGRIVSTDR